MASLKSIQAEVRELRLITKALMKRMDKPVKFKQVKKEATRNDYLKSIDDRFLKKQK